jgi:hypothetical protein
MAPGKFSYRLSSSSLMLCICTWRWRPLQAPHSHTSCLVASFRPNAGISRPCLATASRGLPSHRVLKCNEHQGRGSFETPVQSRKNPNGHRSTPCCLHRLPEGLRRYLDLSPLVFRYPRCCLFILGLVYAGDIIWTRSGGDLFGSVAGALQLYRSLSLFFGESANTACRTLCR